MCPVAFCAIVLFSIVIPCPCVQASSGGDDGRSDATCRTGGAPCDHYASHVHATSTHAAWPCCAAGSNPATRRCREYGHLAAPGYAPRGSTTYHSGGIPTNRCRCRQ